ncbi:type II secretion system F family protein [Nocardioides mangrovi]|uniref:Type II secretion system F family protein n=1 Tax=Nocardioides mangrovi TaxID=2874580 RepID=A0ABS7UDM6_9ACTN|nr:type II secretion system F family protein [Nocardioides mangrovi]MBZ5739103.1 type II secretion system F family protein [Nocardioides mangrovi]
MTAEAWLAALAAGAAVALLVPVRARLPDLQAPAAAGGPPEERGLLHRFRLVWSVLAGCGAFAFLGGPAAPVAAVVAAATTWVLVGRSEPPATRRRRESVRRELPHLVELFAATLRGGASPGDGIAVVCAALPGPAADRLAGVAARLSLGLDPVAVWSALETDPELGRLGRALARAQASGAPVVASVERLADDLSRSARAETEERARSVGVKAAVPLGLCLLPAFLLVGIVPLVVALLATLDL